MRKAGGRACAQGGDPPPAALRPRRRTRSGVARRGRPSTRWTDRGTVRGTPGGTTRWRRSLPVRDTCARASPFLSRPPSLAAGRPVLRPASPGAPRGETGLSRHADQAGGAVAATRPGRGRRGRPASEAPEPGFGAGAGCLIRILWLADPGKGARFSPEVARKTRRTTRATAREDGDAARRLGGTARQERGETRRLAGSAGSLAREATRSWSATPPAPTPDSRRRASDANRSGSARPAGGRGVRPTGTVPVFRTRRSSTTGSRRLRPRPLPRRPGQQRPVLACRTVRERVRTGPAAAHGS